MSEQNLGSIPPAGPSDVAIRMGLSADPLAAGLEGHVMNGRAPLRRAATQAEIEDARALVRTVQEQLARDLADIERATADLRRAEPALQSWRQPSTPAAPKAHPVWLIIGVLWLSTAIVTVGAAVAIAALAG